jgi:hypothetical protein
VWQWQPTTLRSRRHCHQWPEFPFVASLDLRQNGCIVTKFSRNELQKRRVAMADNRRIMRLTGFLAVLALIGVGGCSASGPEPPFETAYSAVGAQIK